MEIQESKRLAYHLCEVKETRRRFESASDSVSRMLLGHRVEKIFHAGQIAYNFGFFRNGGSGKHIVGWFDEINHLVNFIKNASEGGSSREMAFVLVGEPGNGKTFFVDYICSHYRQFLKHPENRRYTFEFINLEQLGAYGKIKVIQSQTFEDPVILAMNFCESMDDNKEFMVRVGFEDKQVDHLFDGLNYRPLGACTEFILSNIRDYCDGNVERMLEFVRIVPVPIAESLGTVTGKYSARDKITSSATDLLGEEDLSRLLNLSDTSNPYKYNVRRGAIARVAGGGIHFSDEIFKNKKDLVQIYLQVIQNRNIELDGYRWPIDTVIIATSNNWEYNRFVSEKEEAPIKDRCKICYVAHNTNYKLQSELTIYAVGSEKKETLMGEDLHEDPNLNYALSVTVGLTRLPHSEKLTPIEMMKLEAGEIAGEKSVKTLIEIKESLGTNPDVTRRWGQKGIGHRGLGRMIQTILSFPETHEGRCVFARDCFKAAEREILDYITEAVDREKFMKDLLVARRLYRERIKTSIFNAYRDDPDAIRKDVLAYVNMIIGSDSDQLGPDKIWRYRDPRLGELKAIKIDQQYIESVESRLGLTTSERRDTFRTSIRKIYGQKVSTNPNYDFMDNESLIKAVTDVRLESDVAGAGSLVGALANRTNEENVRIYNRMIETMFDKLAYCKTCAQKTIEYFCEKVDES